MKEKSYLSLVVYVAKNTSYINKFVGKLNKYISDRFEHFEIILVNNGIKESNLIIDESVRKKITGHASIINLPWKQNIESAMLAGTDLSIGDFVIEIDNPENIYDFSIINEIYKKCTSGIDIVSAIPSKKADIITQMFYNFIKQFSYIGISLNSEPIRIITRRALNSALKSKEKIRYRQILYLLTGFLSSQITYKTKHKYTSNKSFSEKFSLALEVILSYTDFGMKLTFGLSILFLLLSISVGLYAIYIYSTLKEVATGWTTTMLFLSFGFSGFFLITGILTKYLIMVLLETKGREPYIIQTIQKLK